MSKSWFVVASKSNVRVYEQKKFKKLNLIESLDNPEAKLKESEYSSDRSGSSSYGAGHTPFTAKTTGKEHNEESFAKEINKFLHKNSNGKKFDKLTIVAPPSFLGLIKKNLDKELDKQVVSYLNKDFGNMSDDEITKNIFS